MLGTRETMEVERIIAVGLLTASDLQRLGSSFDRAYPVEDCAGFADLLAAIDQADADRCARTQDAQILA
jgi:hypothetical protein